MPPELPTPEVPAVTPEASETAQLQLSTLRDHVEKEQFDTLVDALMGTAAEGDEVPDATIDAFISELKPQEMTALKDFFLGKTDPRIVELREKLGTLQPQPEAAPTAVEGLSATTQKIVVAVDSGIARLASGGMLGGVAAKFGIKEVGPKQLEFVRNSFLGYITKLMEKVIQKLNFGMDLSTMLRVPLELRLMNIKDPDQKKAYEDLYVQRARESKGDFVAPELRDLGAQTTVVQPEQSLVAGNKVEATQKPVKNADGTKMFDISYADKKTIVTTEDKTVEVKVTNAEITDVMALDATSTDKAGLIFKLKDKADPIAIDGAALCDAVAQKKEHFTTSDGIALQLLSRNS